MFKQTTRGLLAALVGLTISALASAAEFYVSPTSSSSGDGSLGRPWGLAIAMAGPAAVHPGDTIWLRGGTYTIPSGGHILCGLRGTAAAPITVAQYPGERATIDIKGAAQGLFFTNSPNPAGAAYVNFKDFEVTNSDTNRVPSMPVGIYVRLSDHLKFINLVVHDTGGGFELTTYATNTEVYGCLIYYNGDDDGQEHGLYIQSVSGYKKATDNIVFNNSGIGIHAFPHTTDSSLLNVSVVGNILFNNGLLGGDSSANPDILVGGEAVAISPVINSNATYKAAPGNLWNNRFGFSSGCTNPTMTNNYFVGTTAWTNCTSSLILTGNTFYGRTYSLPTYGAPATALNVTAFPNNTFTTTRPTGTRVFVRPNQYEAGRANIAVYNWDRKSSVDVDLGDVLASGNVYEVRNAQDYFGTAVVTGVYDGSLIHIPLSGLTVGSPVGLLAPLPTGLEFNAFVVVTLGEGSGVPTPRPPVTPAPLSPTPIPTPGPGLAGGTTPLSPTAAPPAPNPTPAPSTLPYPWLHQDIGSPVLSGSASYSAGTFTVKAAGADIWGSSDQFHYVYRPLSGDGTIIARVASIQNTDPWAKTGVMIRESLASNSTFAEMIVSPGKGLAFQRRLTTGGMATHTEGAMVAAPYWVKMTRRGNTFTGYSSPDGVTWTRVGSDTIVMAYNVYVGLPLTAHSYTKVCTAQLGRVTLTRP
jgi:hypothetical protein